MKDTYKGHEFEIKFCDPNQDWREHVGMFHIELAMGNSDFFSTYDAAVVKAKEIIDAFVLAIPQNNDEWMRALSDCMVWTGYEDCHLDEGMVVALLVKASQFYKREKKEDG